VITQYASATRTDSISNWSANPAAPEPAGIAFCCGKDAHARTVFPRNGSVANRREAALVG
jgi:hypothetical protein